MTGIDLDRINAECGRLREAYMSQERPGSSARGLHHVATARLGRREDGSFLSIGTGFPLTEIFENRDYQGSNHLFFDIGHENLIAFFDFRASTSARC